MSDEQAQQVLRFMFEQFWEINENGLGGYNTQFSCYLEELYDTFGIESKGVTPEQLAELMRKFILEGLNKTI